MAGKRQLSALGSRLSEGRATARTRNPSRRQFAESREPRAESRSEATLLLGLGLYNLLQIALSPLLVTRFLRHVFWKKRDHDGWAQRLGLRRALSPEAARIFRASSPRVWIFCRSIGEYRATLPFIRGLSAACPAAAVLIFSITDEVQRAMAQSSPGDQVFAAYLPYDALLPSLVHLLAAPPDLLLFVESFWYPSLLPLALLARSGPEGRRPFAALLNFAVKPITFRHTRRFTFRHWLRHALDLYCVQSEADASALTRLGVSEGACVVAGNAKFDLERPTNDERPTTNDAPEVLVVGRSSLVEFRRELGAGESVLVAGSTHDGEEEPVLAAFVRARESVPGAQLILAPRYLRRLAEIEARAGDLGLRCARRTGAPHAPGSWDLLLLDTIGELAHAYGLGVAAFVGGSFAPVGGHNLVEPIAAGVPTFFGPHIEAFRAIAADAEAAGVAEMAPDPDALASAWLRALQDPEYRREVRTRAESLMRTSSGATARWLEALAPHLEPDTP